MEAKQVSVNDRGVIRVQLVGMASEALQASEEARLLARGASAAGVELLYSLPESPPRGFDWCRDFIFGYPPRRVPGPARR